MKKLFLNKRFQIIVTAFLAIGIIVKISQDFGTKKIEEIVIENKKTAEIVNFGDWAPTSSQEVLGTVVREDETDVSAEINGTIEKTFVQIGDSVKKNQILAIYKKFDDLTQISYENAIRTFNTTKLTTQNTIHSSEISLNTAIQELKQTENTQQQNRRKVFDELKTRAQNSETVFNNFLNWADRILGASSKYRYQVDATRQAIGRNDSLKKREVKNETEKLVRAKENSDSIFIRAQEEEILKFSETKITHLELAQSIAWKLDNLIRNTTLSTSFMVTDRTSFQTESSSFLSQINGEILILSSTIEAAKSIDETTRQTILTAENRVEIARASLELANANGQSQISSVQSQLALASSSLNDLEIRAPFAGKIFFEDVTNGKQVSVGQKLFSVTNENSLLKVEAYLSASELTTDKKIKGAKIEFANGEIVESGEILVSGKLDTETQKFKTVFYLPEVMKNITSGSFAKIFIPTQNGYQNLLPVSAFSFEPGGAEVLVLDENNVLKRKKVQTGKIITDSVEVLSGLESDEKVVRFRNRFYAGQEITISN